MALDLGELVARLRVDSDMRRGLTAARAELDDFRRTTTTRLRDLRERFASEGRAAGDGLGQGMRRGLGRVREMFSDVGDKLGDLAKKGAAGLKDLASAAAKFAKENPKIIVGGLLGLLGALPLASGLAASAITLGLGGAIAGLGIKAAASSKRVQDAFSDLRDDLRDGLRDAAEPFEGSLVRMIGTARKELSGLGDDTARAFATLAPSVEKAFASVARAVGDLGPTIGYIAQQAGPLVEVLGKELGSLTRSLAGDFRKLAEAADPRFITILTGAVRALAFGIAEVISKASAFGSWILDLAGMDRPAASARNLGAAFVEVAAGARDASEAVDNAEKEFAEYLDPGLAVFNATTNMRKSFKDLSAALRDSGGSFKGNSDAALRSRDSLNNAIQSVREMYNAQRRNGDSHDEARAAIERQIKALQRSAGDSKQARTQVDNLKRALDALKDKDVTVTVTTKYVGSANAADALRRAKEIGGATGGLYTGSGFKRGYDTGGLVKGPGSGTSDDVPAPWLSNGEYVIRAASVRKIGTSALDRLNRAGDLGTLRRDALGTSTTQTDSQGEGLGTSRLTDPAVLAQLRKQLKAVQDVLKDFRKSRSELIKDLSSTSADAIAGASKSLRDAVKAAFSSIADATRLDDRLYARINQTSARLKKMADEREALAERIQEAFQVRDTVQSGAQNFASILGIRVIDEDGNEVDPNAGELATGLRARLKSLKDFAANLKQLAAQGLSKTIFRQLAEAGPEQAGAFAEAIAKGGQAAVNELTGIQNEIDAQSKELGEFSADHLYDAGAAAGQGFLTGLTTQLQQLEGAMETLAKQLVAAVEAGIKQAEEAAKKKVDKAAQTPKKDALGTSTTQTDDRGNALGTSRRSAAPASALNITNYYESNRGSARGTAEELLLLTRARG